MSVLIENEVTLEDVAAGVGSTVDQVEAEARSLNIFIGVDWLGRPAISKVEAASLVDGSLRRDTDHRASWMAHQAAVETWEKEREQVRSDAFLSAYRAARARGMGDSQSTEEGHKAGAAAMEKFGRQHPAPTYQEAAEGRPSWQKRVVGAGR